MLAPFLSLMLPKPYRGKAGEEDLLSISVANYLRAATIEGRLLATWTSVPHEVGAVSRHGASFGAAVAKYAKQKAMGLIPGSGDFVFVWPNGGGWIELKVSGGSLSDNQKQFRDWCVATGNRYALCRTVDQVVEKLLEWGALTAR